MKQQRVLHGTLKHSAVNFTVLGVGFSLHSLVVVNWPILTVGCVMKYRKSWCKKVRQSNLIMPRYGFWTFVFSFQPLLDLMSPYWCHPIPQTRFRKAGKEQSWLCLHPALSVLPGPRAAGPADSPVAPGVPRIVRQCNHLDNGGQSYSIAPSPTFTATWLSSWKRTAWSGQICFCPPLPFSQNAAMLHSVWLSSNPGIMGRS